MNTQTQDFGTHVNLDTYADGMYPIAWAFLKVVSSKGKPNYGQLRLQLYSYNFAHASSTLSSRTLAKYKQLFAHRLASRQVPPVYFEWVFLKNNIDNTRRRRSEVHSDPYRYPSSLWIEIKGVHRPKVN